MGRTPVTKMQEQAEPIHFYDISYQYSLVQEKMDIELKGGNIANTNAFEDVCLTAQLNQAKTDIL